MAGIITLTSSRRQSPGSPAGRKDDPTRKMPARIAIIEIIDTISGVRPELDNWTGYRFTDWFTMLKVENYQ
ncbi:MAG: hypothetical protein QNJ18_01760 [Xenococcaceae cyanobacterium MO_167.B52]|nr:hypothetical protein [Xenococcaceae cyanobacterium MO_167.B52]